MAFRNSTALIEPFVNCYCGRVILGPDRGPTSRSLPGACVGRRLPLAGGVHPPYPLWGPWGIMVCARLRLRPFFLVQNPHLITRVYRGIPPRMYMEKLPCHKIASLCQRMPLDVYVCMQVGEEIVHVRVVKSDLAETLRAQDGRLHLNVQLTLTGIYIFN